MPTTRATHYVMAGSFKGTDGNTYTIRTKVGTSNPQDVAYQHAQKRIARAIEKSPKYAGGGVTFKITKG